MELIEVLLSHAPEYLHDWRPWFFILITVVLNFWVVDLVRPRTREKAVWLVRGSSIFLCVGLSLVLSWLEGSSYNRITLFSAACLGITTPFLYKSVHSILYSYRPTLFTSCGHDRRKGR